MFLSGNLSVYAVKLEEKYGMGILQELDKVRKEEEQIRADRTPAKVLSREVLEDMIKLYKEWLRELEGPTLDQGGNHE
jgi:hypothetical protein